MDLCNVFTFGHNVLDQTGEGHSEFGIGLLNGRHGGTVLSTSASQHRFRPGALVSSHRLKDVLVRCIAHAKFSLSVPEQAPECGDSGIFTVTSLQC